MQKYIRFLMIVALMLPWMSNAQSTLTVADGTATSMSVPVYGNYMDEPFGGQSLYPASLLTDMVGETILSLHYYVSSGSSSGWGTNKSMVVKMMVVPQNDLSAAYVDVSNATVVYNGFIQAGDATVEDGFTVELTTPFLYTGGNLLVSYQVNAEDAPGYSNLYFYGATMTAASRNGFGAGNCAFTAAGAARNFLPKTTFAYGTPPSCLPVQTLMVTAVTSSTMTLSWVDPDNTGATYTVYDMVDTSVVASGVTGTSYTVNSLTANSEFTFGVVANCSPSDQSALRTTSGHTTCDPITSLPWTDDLEDVPSESYSMPYCWNRYVSSYNSNNPIPYDFANGSYALSGTHSLYWFGSTSYNYPDTMIAILPELDTALYPMGANRLGFWARMESSSYDKMISVGTMGNPGDPNTFTLIENVPVSGSTYTYHTVNLTGATDPYVALRVVKGNGSIYVDDLILEQMPSCFEVSGLEVTDATNSSVTLSWTDSHNSNVTYSVFNMSDTSILAGNVTGTSTVVSGLTANTLYTFGVVANCTESNASFVTITVRTGCDAIEAPHTWTFEDDDANATPACWYKVGDGLANVLSSTGNSHDGSHYLRFSGSTGNLLLLPEFQNQINTLQLRFWTRPESFTNSSCGTFSVGYVTTASDSSFVPLATFSYNDFTAYTEKTVLFTDAPTGARMAMRHNAVNTNWYWYVDDVTVESAPNCLPVTQLAVANLTTSSATLSWHGAASVYKVYDMSDTTLLMSVTDTFAMVVGLDADTLYTLGVAADCGSELSPIVSLSFRTPCTPESFPYAENFNSSVSSNPCWAGASGVTAAEVFAGSALPLGDIPSAWNYQSSTNNGLEAGHYRVNIYGSNCKYWIVLPSIDLSGATSAQLSFDAAFTVYSSSSDDPASGFENNDSQAFMVLVSTDGGASWPEANAVKWQNVGGQHTLVSLASSDYINQTVDLTAYLGQTIRIAFYAQSTTAGGDNNLHIDNIVVGEVPSPQPQSDSVLLDVSQEYPTHGTVAFVGTTEDRVRAAEGDTFVAIATPDSGYRFVYWAIAAFRILDTTFTVEYDTVYDNPYQIVVDSTLASCESLMLIAHFETLSGEIDSMTIVLATADATMGTTTPAPGTYRLGCLWDAVYDSLTFAALPNPGYHFLYWVCEYRDIATGDIILVDTNHQETRTIVSANWLLNYMSCYTAYFEADSTPIVPDMVTVTFAVNDASMGTIAPSGTHQYAVGDAITVTATPYDGYRLASWTLSWNDIDEIQNVDAEEGQYSYRDTIDSLWDGMTLTANFIPVQGIDQTVTDDVNISILDGKIVVKGEGELPVTVYDVTGRILATAHLLPFTFNLPSSGVYLVRAGNAPVKRIVMIK